MDDLKARRIRDEIIGLCRAGLDSWAVRDSALQLLRRVIPVDAFWFATADPATLLFTGSLVEEIPEDATGSFLNNEFLVDDVNKWVTMAREGRPNSLYQATQGQPETSARFREILQPLGFGDELRAAFTDGHECWGFVCLHRELDGQSFREEEIEFLASITRHLAGGLRSGLILENLRQSADVGSPGVVVLSAADLSVLASTEQAERWLYEIRDRPKRKELPQAVYAVAVKLLEFERSGGAGTILPRVRVRSRTGRWLLLHASPLRGDAANGQIAVVIEPALPADVAPLVFSAYGLTLRESEVAGLVLRGMSTAQIAENLVISGFTVKEHLKAIFEKVGATSRQQLTAKVFAEQYMPRLMNGSLPDANGGFRN